MFEFLLGLFITALLNGIWSSKDPYDNPRYWSNKEYNVSALDSIIFEDVYKFDSIVYFNGDSTAIKLKK